MTGCLKCSRQDLPVSPLHDDKGGPLFYLFCAGAWHAEHSRRRKWGRIIIKAMKMYEKEGGAWADFDKMKLAVAGWDVGGFEADTIGAEISDITAELLASTIELTHPDRHPSERREIATRVTQELLALKPFVFPAPKPKPVSTPKSSNGSLKSPRVTTKEPLWCTYPCELCHDTVPYYYCDPCKAEWRKRRREERESDNAKQRQQYARRRQRALYQRGPTICRGCSTEFKARRKDAVYCSAACRQRAHRQRRKSVTG